MMAEEQHQQQRINQAAEQLANVIRESYQTMAERGMAVQELNAQLTQEFFNRVIENLRAQVEETQQMGQQLADQQQRATEAGHTLTQESVRAYMDFVNSMFSFGQESMQASQGGARDFQGRFTRGEEAWDESEHHRDARGRFT
jgi:ABC-type transporter Mla subunit MlaD